MTKSEYMQRLQEKLDSFGKELSEEILEDYRQHFAEGELQGRTDEEIIEELGNIEDMIRELSESELKANMGYRLPDPEGMVQAVRQGAGRVPGTQTAGTAAEGADRYGQEGAQQESAGTDGCSHFSYSGRYDKIVLEGEEADIYVRPSEDDSIHVEYINRLKNGQAKYEYCQRDENGVFYAGIKRRQRGQECWTGIEGDEKSWRVKLFGRTVVSYRNVGDSVNSQMLALCVSVPKGVPELTANVSSGDVQVYDLAQKSMLLGSSSGDVKVEKVVADTVKIHSSSGDVFVGETKCCSRLDASASSGDVKIQGVVLKEEKAVGFAQNEQEERDGRRELIAKSSSGDVSIRSVTAEKVNAASSSGDVDIQNVTATNAGIRSSSGDVSASNVKCSGELALESFSGDLAVACVEAEAFTVRSSGGDLAVFSAVFNAGSIQASRGDLALAKMKFTSGVFKADSGDMALSELQFDTGEFVTRQGDIAISSLEFKAGSFTTHSGDIACENLSGDFGAFNAENGDIILRDPNGRCCRGYQCVIGDGDISIESSAEIYECRSRSGDISVHAAGAPRKLTIEASSGDISASAKGTPESVSLQSKSGDVRLKLGETEGMDVEIDAGNGDAYIKWDGHKDSVKKGSYTYGTGACKVKASSRGGDVVVSGYCG